MRGVNGVTLVADLRDWGIADRPGAGARDGFTGGYRTAVALQEGAVIRINREISAAMIKDNQISSRGDCRSTPRGPRQWL